MKNDVLEHHKSRLGEYTFQGVLNEMPFWAIKIKGENEKVNEFAIWFHDGSWRVGWKRAQGTNTAHLKSKEAMPCPNSSGMGWEYEKVKEFKDAGEGDVIIEEKSNGKN